MRLMHALKNTKTNQNNCSYYPETQEIESYEFGPGKIGVNLDYGYVEPELRFWLNSETYKIKKYMNEVE